MRSRSSSFVHCVLLMLLCLNSFVFFVVACMKTIPADAVSISGAQLSDSPLQKVPVLPQSDYSAHLKKYRAAKLFSSSSPSDTTDLSQTSISQPSGTLSTSEESRTRPVSHRQPTNAKVFASKTDIRSETPNNEKVDQPEPVSVISNTEDGNNIHDDRDLFEALQVEKPDICGSCPPIWMKNNAEMKDICANYESVSTFFSMTLDTRDAKHVVDTSDLKECTRTITCSEPHMLVKWHESELCDVHAPYAGTLITETTNSFVYKCNGTQWTLHGFPLSSVVCAISSN